MLRIGLVLSVLAASVTGASAQSAAKPPNVIIFFDRGVSAMSATAHKVAAETLGYVKASSRISIVGHADRSEEKAIPLSRARAQAVRASLIKAGVPPKAIVKVEGAGTKDLLVPTAAGEREPQNRFVRITIR